MGGKNRQKQEAVHSFQGSLDFRTELSRIFIRTGESEECRSERHGLKGAFDLQRASR